MDHNDEYTEARTNFDALNDGDKISFLFNQLAIASHTNQELRQTNGNLSGDLQVAQDQSQRLATLLEDALKRADINAELMLQARSDLADATKCADATAERRISTTRTPHLIPFAKQSRNSSSLPIFLSRTVRSAITDRCRLPATCIHGEPSADGVQTEG